MKELIKITEQNGIQAVSAKELYEVLEYNKAVWSRWYQKNIENNEFYFENIDYQTLTLMVNGNETKDFDLTIDFSKKLGMKANSAKGEEVREYFLECERIAKNPVAHLSKIDLAQMVIEREKERLQIQNQLQQQKLQKQAPKGSLFFVVVFL
ncbi:antA/AntB antirepressor family protein [Capnocytophaga sp. ARDL2]|uniref:antA/AntB antirepressor family protein n=1 Tax=Capnocytophaga sp. ARDL2 TaxID=3238809 RepID=UPI003556FF03